MVWSLTRLNTAAEEKILTSAVPAFSPSISKGLSGGGCVVLNCSCLPAMKPFLSSPFTLCAAHAED